MANLRMIAMSTAAVLGTMGTLAANRTSDSNIASFQQTDDRIRKIEGSVVPVLEKHLSLFNDPSSDNVKKFLEKYPVVQASEIKGAMARSAEKIRVVSYNILFDLGDKDLPEVHHWQNRIGRLITLIGSMQPDILPVQELYGNMADDFLPRLEEHFPGVYGFYSLASDPSLDCKNEELNGIFYRKDRFDFLCGNVIPMNDVERLGREGLTQATLQDRLTGKKVAVFNAHLYFSKSDKRLAQAQFINAVTERYLQSHPDTAVIVTGDMNTFPNRPELPLPARDGDKVEQAIVRGGHLQDARFISQLGYFGGFSTYTNDPEKFKATGFLGTGTPGVILDHIYTSDKIQVLIFGTENGKVDGHYPSDHFPIIADVIID